MLELIDVKDTRKCYKCGGHETYIDRNGRDHWSYHYGDDKKWTGEWLCDICRKNTEEAKKYSKKYYRDRYNEIKYITNCRSANINIKGERCKGCIGAQICANTLGVKDLNIETDNFIYYVDLSEHINYGYSEVKTATFNETDGRWYFNRIHKENFDTLLLVCMDQYDPWNNVRKIYAIPSNEITTTTTITVYKRSSVRIRWYESFEIDSKPFNDNYHRMDINICPIINRIPR